MQQSYTFCYLLSEWHSRAKKSNYKKRDWPSWQSLEVGTKNAQHLLQVESSNILLPSVHIRLGLTKNFFKVTGSAFRYFSEKFPGISAAKTKGVFFGQQMCKLLRHKHLDQILVCNEKRIWIDFWLLAAYFLGSNKADNHKELVEIILLSFLKLFIITRMFVQKSLGHWMKSMAIVFIMVSQQWITHQGKLSSLMMVDHCWTCVQTAGKEVVRLIKARQSVYTVSWM